MINVEEFIKQGEATLDIGNKFKDALAYLNENFDTEGIQALVDTNPKMKDLNERFGQLG